MMRLPQLASLSLILILGGSLLTLSPSNAFLTATTPIDQSSRPLPRLLRVQQELRKAVITLERSACFGSCPMYKLTIYGNGKVVYEGIEYVKVKGKRTGTISPEDFSRLMNEFQRAQYFDLADSYSGGPTDAAYVITSLKIAGKNKTVNHYLASPDAPSKLTELEKKIDGAVKVQRWVGTNAERIPR